MAVKLPDVPKLLRDSSACEARRLELYEPHMVALTALVRRLRKAMPESVIPDFDPWDGGVESRVLFLLEAPGPKAGASGFISRNNPDETAKNFHELNAEAELPRRVTVIWNAVPWYIGTGTKIRSATGTDLRAGLPPLLELIGLLPHLQVIVLVGGKAQLIESELKHARSTLRYFKCPHPSPMFVNRAAGNRQRILDVLRKIADVIHL